jgi:hypothetical protein
VRRRLGAVAVAAVVGVLAGACSADERSTPAVPHIFALNDDPAAVVAPVASDRVNVLAAAQLRLVLEELLGWHVVTLTEVMARTERGDKDLQRWMDALAGNSEDIIAAVGLVYGPVAARAFAQLWANHTQFLIDYSAAKGNHDPGGQRDALDHLGEYERDNAALLGRATGGKAPTGVVQRQLTAHVTQMTNALDAAAAGEHDRHAQISLEALGYAADIGQDLAGAIAAQQPTAFPGPLDADNTALCSLVNRRLGSWAMLAGGATDGLWKAAVAAPLRHDLLANVDDETGRLGWTALDGAGFAFDITAVAPPGADPPAVLLAGRHLAATLAALGDHATAEQVKALYDAANDIGPALYP